MKTTSLSLYKLVLALVVTLGLFTGAATTAQAHDGQWDSRHHYYRDNYGYWDNGDHYRHYEHWNNHVGYWDTRGGTRIFINVE